MGRQLQDLRQGSGIFDDLPTDAARKRRTLFRPALRNVSNAAPAFTARAPDRARVPWH
jgi:hypothetical protein